MTAKTGRPGRPLIILWTDRARRDLAAIGDHIAADNPSEARRWVDLLIADVERAAEMPLAGRVVPEVDDRKDIRELIRRTFRTRPRQLPNSHRRWCFCISAS
ncbi:MAG: type II toxin-antitoxin system RelE/ParE family toxin [Deltaproteobacteria bacterium]|nr:type II toxin-antitoxin system RelE/ParE family toxin [Deltaproteobacteria bacterium]